MLDRSPTAEAPLGVEHPSITSEAAPNIDGALEVSNGADTAPEADAAKGEVAPKGGAPNGLAPNAVLSSVCLLFRRILPVDEAPTVKPSCGPLLGLPNFDASSCNWGASGSLSPAFVSLPGSVTLARFATLADIVAAGDFDGVICGA